MEKKVCYNCKNKKDLSKFSNNKTKKDGKSGVCKECHSKYRKNRYSINKDIELTQVKLYQKSHCKSNYSSKAGRTVEANCPICNNIVFLTKKESLNSFIRYCSTECRATKNKSLYYHYLKGVERRAIKHNKEFNLTEDFIKDLLENKQNNLCKISNIKIKLYHHNENKSLSKSASLDRIDSTKGYTQDNVQWICLGINYMKLDYDEQEVHNLLKLIKENYIPVV